MFAGDICYNQGQLLASHFAGADVSSGKSKDTYQKVKSLAEKGRLVFLPSHDSRSAERLMRLDFLLTHPA